MSLVSFRARALAALPALWLTAASPPPDPGIPVAILPAARADVPVYAAGLGTVSALNSALIRARVDGTLDSVAFTEGQEVHKGDLLAVIDPRPYQAAFDEAMAKRNQDAATLVNARRDLSRYTTLAGSGYASRQSADTQVATVAAAAAQVDADQAAVQAAALNVAFTHVTAPIDGRVGLRQVNPGNLVHATDSQGLVLVTQLHPIGVLFTLPQQAVTDVADAQATGSAPVVQVFDPADGAVLAEGRLLTADNMIDTQTGTIQLKAAFANEHERLWPGAFVQARIRLRVLHQVVTVPARAVQRGQDGLFVFVATADGHAEQRAVTEYLEADGVAAIRAGLQTGEQVVVDGQSRVSNGAKLDSRPAGS